MARRLIALAVAVAVFVGTGCDEPTEVVPPPEPRDGPRIVVGAFDFTESELLAEIYAQALVAHRYDAVVRRGFDFGAGIGAFEDSNLGLLVEYTGHGLRTVQTADQVPYRGPQRVYDVFKKEMRERDLRVYEMARAQNRDTFVVTAETAKRWKVSALSDLRRVERRREGRLRLGGAPGCETRLSCLPGLAEVYDLRPKFIELDAAGPETVQALKKGKVDFALMYSSQGALHANGFVELRDDRQLQLPQHLVPVVAERIHEAYGPRFSELINRITSELTPKVLIALNKRTEVAAKDPAEVARKWLKRSGLLERGPKAERPSERGNRKPKRKHKSERGREPERRPDPGRS